MKVLSIFLLLAIATAFGQKTDAAADKSMLIALENAWNQAQIHRDGKALDDLITDQFIYTDWDGTIMNKSKFIADSKDTSVQTTLVANDHVEVFFYPGVAIVAGAYHAKGINQGKPFDHHGRFTDTWIQSKGTWQCVASHTNLIRK
jgi:hypothetical protein